MDILCGIWYNPGVKTLFRKKAITLYETRLRPSYIVKTVVFYVIAAVLWYIIAVIAPYMDTAVVGEAENYKITREALSATDEQIARDESQKERALLMPASEASFARRLRLIEDAKHSVNQLLYNTYDQQYSYYYYTALIRAAQRGVKVRIIADGKMGRLTGGLKELRNILLNHNNIELYYFNQADVLEPAGLMVLMHDKMTVVDGGTLIIGGVNLGTDVYLSNYDMEVMITNSGKDGVAGQAEEYFSRFLSSGLVKRIMAKNADFGEFNRYNEQFSAFFEQSEFGRSVIDYRNQGVAVDKVTLITNPISNKKKAPIILQAIFNLMESSGKSTVVTPYVLLEKDKKDRLTALAAKNDSFTVITNSLYNTRNVGYADYYYTRSAYLREDIELREYMAENQLHAKMFSFDDRYSVIGSFNLDERSAHIDTESVVVIDSPTFNAILNRYINDVFVKNSLQVGGDNNYIPSETVQAPPVPGSKKFKYFLFSILGIIRCVL